MSVINSIRDWLAACPLLEDFRELFIDYLDSDECYGIEVEPVEPIVKRYVNGDTVRQKAFSFCSVAVLSGLDNIDTTEFFENFAEWVEEQNREGNLPDLGDKKQCLSIKATTDGYAYDFTGVKVQYRIQMNMKYYMEV